MGFVPRDGRIDRLTKAVLCPHIRCPHQVAKGLFEKASRIGRTCLLCSAILLAGGACGSKGGKKRGKPKPTPTPAPPVPPKTRTRYLGWYDLTHPSMPVDTWLGEAARSSNLMYMRVDRGEYSQLIPKAVAQGWPAVILMAREEHYEETAQAARAVVDNGLNLLGVIAIDEADLRAPMIRQNVNLTQFLTHVYHSQKQALADVGLAHIPVANTTWSLASPPPWTWKDKLNAFGVPLTDLFVTDGWYSRPTEIHLVRHRAIEWLDTMRAALGDKPIIHVLKAWSRVPPDLEEITPEWVLRQLRCVTGLGTSEYDWTNPNTGEVAHVVVEPLSPEFQGEVLLYKMDPVPSDDSRWAGGNRKDVVDAVRELALPQGWVVA